MARPKGIKAGTKAERLAAELGKGQTTPLKYMLNMLNNPKYLLKKRCGQQRKLHHLYILN